MMRRMQLKRVHYTTISTESSRHYAHKHKHMAGKNMFTHALRGSAKRSEKMTNRREHNAWIRPFIVHNDQQHHEIAYMLQ